MARACKRGRLANRNTDVRTHEMALNVATGYEVGRAAATATTIIAQTTDRICRPKVERALRLPGN